MATMNPPCEECSFCIVSPCGHLLAVATPRELQVFSPNEPAEPICSATLPFSPKEGALSCATWVCVPNPLGTICSLACGSKGGFLTFVDRKLHPYHTTKLHGNNNGILALKPAHRIEPPLSPTALGTQNPLLKEKSNVEQQRCDMLVLYEGNTVVLISGSSVMAIVQGNVTALFFDVPGGVANGLSRFAETTAGILELDSMELQYDKVRLAGSGGSAPHAITDLEVSSVAPSQLWMGEPFQFLEDGGAPGYARRLEVSWDRQWCVFAVGQNPSVACYIIPEPEGFSLKRAMLKSVQQTAGAAVATVKNLTSFGVDWLLGTAKEKPKQVEQPEPQEHQEKREPLSPLGGDGAPKRTAWDYSEEYSRKLYPLCSFMDEGRCMESVKLAPDHRTLATSDSCGRVMLFDVPHMCPIRVMKGYRGVEMAWLRRPSDRQVCEAAYLVVYARRRALLEVWQSGREGRCDAAKLDYRCRIPMAMAVCPGQPPPQGPGVGGYEEVGPGTPASLLSSTPLSSSSLKGMGSNGVREGQCLILTGDGRPQLLDPTNLAALRWAMQKW